MNAAGKRFTLGRSARHLTALAVLACAGAWNTAMAQQTLARGVTVSDTRAVTQPDGQITTLRAKAVNNSGKPIELLTVRFELYDAANQIVGEATTSQANMTAGETWDISVDTPVRFTRFTVMNVDAQ